MPAPKLQERSRTLDKYSKMYLMVSNLKRKYVLEVTTAKHFENYTLELVFHNGDSKIVVDLSSHRIYFDILPIKQSFRICLIICKTGMIDYVFRAFELS